MPIPSRGGPPPDALRESLEDNQARLRAWVRRDPRNLDRLEADPLAVLRRDFPYIPIPGDVLARDLIRQHLHELGIGREPEPDPEPTPQQKAAFALFGDVLREVLADPAAYAAFSADARPALEAKAPGEANRDVRELVLGALDTAGWPVSSRIVDLPDIDLGAVLRGGPELPPGG